MEGTVAGHFTRRLIEVDLANHALILAAMGFMLLVPLLVCLSAVLPLGGSRGVAFTLGERFSMSPAAVADLQQLFPSRTTVLDATTALSIAVALVSAVSWPIALQRGYERAWGLPALGVRDLWRPLVWLVSFLGLVALATVTASLAHGWVGLTLLTVLSVFVVTAWAWWSQRLLVGGRVGWRRLLPGAIAIGVGLVGLRLCASVLLSPSITSYYDRYGQLGVVLMMLSWFIAYSVVMLSGALIGAVLHERSARHRRSAATHG